MSASEVEISCPHCGRSYKVKLNLERLTRVRSKAVCARCQKSFDVASRVLGGEASAVVSTNEVTTKATEEEPVTKSKTDEPPPKSKAKHSSKPKESRPQFVNPKEETDAKLDLNAQKRENSVQPRGVSVQPNEGTNGESQTNPPEPEITRTARESFASALSRWFDAAVESDGNLAEIPIEDLESEPPEPATTSRGRPPPLPPVQETKGPEPSVEAMDISKRVTARPPSSTETFELIETMDVLQSSSAPTHTALVTMKPSTVPKTWLELADTGLHDITQISSPSARALEALLIDGK
jgi:transcription elongation factor Elf1